MPSTPSLSPPKASLRARTPALTSQVDGTPYDWLGDGRRHCMHLVVDEATTGVLGGWFMERGHMRGYMPAFHGALRV